VRFCANVDGELLAQTATFGKNLDIPERKAAHMPQVTIKTGIAGPDGREEELIEYLCDWPDCPNVAEHVLGCVKELGLPLALCELLAAASRKSGG
jgi:hypothetical protein